MLILQRLSSALATYTIIHAAHKCKFSNKSYAHQSNVIEWQNLYSASYVSTLRCSQWKLAWWSNRQCIDEFGDMTSW